MAALQNDGEEDNAELLALQRIDETCTNFQQNGQYLEALECMERGLVLRPALLRRRLRRGLVGLQDRGRDVQFIGHDVSPTGGLAMVLELLKKAEILTERDPAGRAVTFNNLACYYRRQGEAPCCAPVPPEGAQNRRSVGKRGQPGGHASFACAVLSQLGRHQSALEHAQQALILLQEELSSVSVVITRGLPKQIE